MELMQRYTALKKKAAQRKRQFDAFIEMLETKTVWLTAPASTRFHLSEERGLLKHSVGVAEILLKLRDQLAPEISDESCVMVGLFHDVGKVGMPGKPYYLPNPDQEQAKNRGIRFVVNTDLVHVDPATRSLYLVAGHIDLTEEEIQAIRYHDGQYIPENCSVAHKEAKLTRLLQYADNWTGCVLEKDGRKPPIGQTKAWYYWEDQDRRGYFLAFVNAQGSCSLRLWDAQSGLLIEKQYNSGNYQDQFEEYLRSGRPLSLSHQPNLEKHCKPALPSQVIEELKGQIEQHQESAEEPRGQIQGNQKPVWERASLLAHCFDLQLKNPEALDIDRCRQMLEAVDKDDGVWPSHFNTDASKEFHRWLINLNTPLQEHAYARLSSWFLTDKEFCRNSPLGRAALQLWNILFCAKPDIRLTEPKKDHKILPERFVLWWPKQQNCQEK